MEETSIWRTPSFSLKYLNFTLANGFINTIARNSPYYKGMNGSLMPIGHKGRFLLMVNAENKTEMEMIEENIKLKLS